MNVATHVFETMGTVVSIRFAAAPASEAVIARVERAFSELDQRYSLYNPHSELSRIASCSIALQDASPHMLDTYALATHWRMRTNGAFTPHRPDGVIDLSGVVKALAMDAAARELESAGVERWILNAGGDVIASPASEASPPWTVGIVDPADRTELLTSVALGGSRRACATSGSAERGDHIWSLHERPELVQVTVVADDILTADVLATAIVAGGAEALDLVCRTWPVDVLAIDADGALRMTPGAIEAMHAVRGLQAFTAA